MSSARGYATGHEIACCLEAVEHALSSKERRFVLINDWFDDSHDEIDDKLARWRNGEDVPGAPSDVVDRAEAEAMIIVGISPGHFETCERCRAEEGR